MRNIAIVAAIVACAAMAPVGVAHGAQRTFVSTTGNDTNPCSLVAPCRSFDTAITQTDPNGEIVVLDSGGYGRVTIDQSITIQAPPGVYAGISVFPGTNGIDITTAGIRVAVRGLTINGQGGGYGISLAAASTLEIDRCTVAHMIGYGIVSQVDGADLSIKDSSIQDNGFAGLFVSGDMKFIVERTRIERNGHSGIDARDGANGSVADTLIAGNGNIGLLFGNQENGVTMALTLSGSRLHQNSGNGVNVGTGMPGTLRFQASDNVIADNAANGVVVSASGGGTVTATLRRNAIAHNNTHGVLVTSLGATLNVADNVVVANGSSGLVQSTSGVLNSMGNNLVRDHTLGDTQGMINAIGGV
jgi:hypothetical protein